MSQIEVLPVAMVKVANGVRLLGTVLVDATSTTPVKVCIAETACKPLYATVERVSGGALTLVTGKMGFNASNTDVMTTAGLSLLSSIGASLPLTLNSPMAVGTPGQELDFQIIIAAGAAATVLVSVYGTDG